MEDLFSYSIYGRVVRGIKGLIIKSALRKKILKLSLATEEFHSFYIICI